jgi:hypothetical protein
MDARAESGGARQHLPLRSAQGERNFPMREPATDF